MRRILLFAMLIVVMTGITVATTCSLIIQGTVTDANGNPVTDAAVTAYKDSALTNPVTGGSDSTDINGEYYIILTATTDGLSAGDTVWVEAVSPTAGTGVNSGQLADACGDPEPDCNILVTCIDINIPEFPTIALPVAAILGLVFIFQRRKDE